MDSNVTVAGLAAGFLQSAQKHPHRPALEVRGARLTYSELKMLARAVADAVGPSPESGQSIVGIFCDRSAMKYAGILGVLMAGGVVVPLNPGFPPDRTLQMIELGDVGTLIVDELVARSVGPILEGARRRLRVVGDPDVIHGLSESWPRHDYVSSARKASAANTPVGVQPADFAYLFFTSGSTGTPKGVGVTHGNASRFVQMSVERYRDLDIGPDDRFSQFYDITFDSSMFDLFVSWAFGASLCCPSAVEWVNPNKFIEAQALTVIDIVPSTGHAMNRARGWRPGRFDRLKLCRFGGEALSAELAQALSLAAPAAAIDNVYGPTECTVDATYYRWDRERSLAESTHGVVPIGVAGSRVSLLVVDGNLDEVPIGAEGELLIGGPQVTPGYWKNPERTASSFVRLRGRDIVHYRTGDLVRRVPDGQPIPYLGRMDYQIKIAGVRIELGEVEQALREISGTDMAVAVGWPPTTSGAAGIVAFVAKPGSDASAIRRGLKARLPAVMVPKDIHVIAEMPLNVNGKIDRKALIERLRATGPSS